MYTASFRLEVDTKCREMNSRAFSLIRQAFTIEVRSGTLVFLLQAVAAPSAVELASCERARCVRVNRFLSQVATAKA